MAIKCRNYQSFGRSVIMKMHAWNSQIVYEISGAIFYGSQLFRNLGINQVNNSRCNMLGLMFGPFFQVHVSIYFNFSLRYIIDMYHVSVRDTNLAQLSICDKKSSVSRHWTKFNIWDTFLNKLYPLFIQCHWGIIELFVIFVQVEFNWDSPFPLCSRFKRLFCEILGGFSGKFSGGGFQM